MIAGPSRMRRKFDAGRSLNSGSRLSFTREPSAVWLRCGHRSGAAAARAMEQLGAIGLGRSGESSRRPCGDVRVLRAAHRNKTPRPGLALQEITLH
jgi:hypothetical protein